MCQNKYRWSRSQRRFSSSVDVVSIAKPHHCLLDSTDDCLSGEAVHIQWRVRYDTRAIKRSVRKEDEPLSNHVRETKFVHRCICHRLSVNRRRHGHTGIWCRGNQKSESCSARCVQTSVSALDVLTQAQQVAIRAMSYLFDWSTWRRAHVPIVWNDFVR